MRACVRVCVFKGMHMCKGVSVHVSFMYMCVCMCVLCACLHVHVLRVCRHCMGGMLMESLNRKDVF